MSTGQELPGLYKSSLRQSHISQLRQTLWDFCASQAFTDVEILAEDGRIWVHKSVLAAFPLFRQLFHQAGGEDDPASLILPGETLGSIFGTIKSLYLTGSSREFEQLIGFEAAAVVADPTPDGLSVKVKFEEADLKLVDGLNKGGPGLDAADELDQFVSIGDPGFDDLASTLDFEKARPASDRRSGRTRTRGVVVGEEDALESLVNEHVLGGAPPVVVAKRKKPYEKATCDECGKVLASVKVLKEHKLAKHSNERPFKCAKCSYNGVRWADVGCVAASSQHTVALSTHP